MSNGLVAHAETSVGLRARSDAGWAERTRWPGRTSRSSGSSFVHESPRSAYGHRGPKRQAGGGLPRSGGRPGIAVSRPSRIPAPSICGSAPRSASVYGCSGLVEEVERRGLLDDLAGVHDHDVVGHFGDDAHVVRDHDHRHLVLLLELVEQVEHAGLHGHVERGRRLVGDQELRVARDRDRDHHALAHPAREPVRVIVEPLLRFRDVHLFEQLDRALAGLGPCRSRGAPASSP